MSDANLGDGGNGDQGNGGAPAWMAQLPGELQGNERFTSFGTIGDMGKAFLELEGKSKDALFIPGENATDEERAAFYTRLGRPESADKYSITRPEDVPETLYNEDMAAAIKAISFKSNMTDAQAQVFNAEVATLFKQAAELQQQQETEKQQQEQQALETAVNTLKDKWKGEEFKANTELASRAFKLFGGEEAKKFIEETKINGLALGDHPIFLEIFANIAKKIGDDTLLGERGGNKTGEMSDEDRAKARFPKTYQK